jgi:WD40 repeat protein
MKTTWRNRVIVIAALAIGIVLGTVSTRDGFGQESTKACVDQYGDPLPEGALARIGTLRLVHLGQIVSLAVSADGKVVASGVQRGGQEDSTGSTLLQTDRFAIARGDRVTHSKIRLWDTKTGKLIREIVSPGAPVSALRFSVDGTTLFASCGRYLCSFNTSDGKESWQQEAVVGGRFNAPVLAERLQLAGDILFSFHSGTLRCEEHRNNRSSCYYHPQKIIRSWDCKTGAPIALPSELECPVISPAHIDRLFHHVAVGQEGKLAAVIVSQADPKKADRSFSAGPQMGDNWDYKDGKLLIIDLSVGKVAHTVAAPTGPFNAMTFSDDGRLLALLVSGELWLVDTKKGTKKVLSKFERGPGFGWNAEIAFSSGSKYLALQLDNGSVQAWSVETGEMTRDPAALGWRPGSEKGGRVVASRYGSTIRLADAETGKPLLQFEGHRSPPALRFSRQTEVTLLSRTGGRVLSWDVRHWKLNATTSIPHINNTDYEEPAGRPMDATISVERQIYGKWNGNTLEVRQVQSDKLLTSISDAAGEPIKLRDVMEDGLPPDSIGYHATMAAFSADGNRLMLKELKRARFFDATSGKPLGTVALSRGFWLGFDFDGILGRRGARFLKNEEHEGIEVFDVDTGKKLRDLMPGKEISDGRNARVLRFRISDDEKVAFGETHVQLRPVRGFSDEKVSIVLWDVETGSILRAIDVLPEISVFWRRAMCEAQFSAFALSDDRRYLALSKANASAIEIWEVASGTKRGELVGHAGPIVSLSFSPDGRQLASGSQDTTILVWDLNRPLRPTKLRDRLDGPELAKLWKTLSLTDASQAEIAIWSLVHAPADSVPFLKQYLQPVKRLSSDEVAKLLAELDSEAFATRTRAESSLERQGELVLKDLESALRQKNSAEKQRRLERLLAAAKDTTRPFSMTDRLAHWRALEVLELIGSVEARQILVELSSGEPGARLTEAAGEAVSRLDSKTRTK